MSSGLVRAYRRLRDDERRAFINDLLNRTEDMGDGAFVLLMTNSVGECWTDECDRFGLLRKLDGEREGGDRG